MIHFPSLVVALAIVSVVTLGALLLGDALARFTGAPWVTVATPIVVLAVLAWRLRG